MRARRGLITLSLLAWLLCRSVSLFARSSVDDFETANRLYEQAKYGEAISHYENLVRSGRTSAAVLFNLGNAYFKNGQLGRAIYNYRRAQALAPRDPDIQANLRFARDHISGSASVQPAVWEHFARYFTLNELSVGAAIFFWACLLLLGLGRWRPSLRPVIRPYVSVTAILLITSTSLLAAASASAREQIAIALHSQIPVHLGPLTESQAAFTVPDGTELRIENRRENWLQVADRSDRSGWVESSQVAVVP